MFLRVASTAAFVLAMSACSQQGSVKAPDSINRMSKAEVEAIVKEMFLTEPEFLEQIVAKLEENKAAAQAKAAEDGWAKLAKNESGDPTLGPANAPITIVEFTDYNCGYCKQAVSWVMNQVDDRRGDIRLVVKESAVRGTNSELAAAAALAAQKQGKWREMHIALMKVPANAYTPEIIETIAKSVGLNMSRFKQDLVSKETKERVDRSVSEYMNVGLEGTPTFFINGTYVGGFGEQHLNDVIKAAREKVKKT
jgi:protein-disulfide isomerase